MSIFSYALCLSVACLLALLLHSTAAAPSPQQPQPIVSAAAEDLATGGAEIEKDDLQGSSSYGYGYYSSYPYLGGLGGYYGGYYPYYSGGYYGGFGYPYYGGYYGGYNGYHGHYY